MGTTPGPVHPPNLRNLRNLWFPSGAGLPRLPSVILTVEMLCGPQGGGLLVARFVTFMSQFPLRSLLCGVALAFATVLPAAPARAEADPGQIAIAVGKLLEQGHYTRRPLDDSVSQQVLKTYLESLDYNHLFFTQKDVADFEKKYSTVLDDEILLGNLQPAFAIYDVYKKRVEDRVAKVKDLLKKQKWEFTSDRTTDLNRSKMPWPKDEAEADQLWAARVEGEMLAETIADSQTDKPLDVVNRRYDRLLRALREQTREDVTNFFLNALALTYDPHSEYLSPQATEAFNINMRLSLVGIGALLRSEDGYAKISELVPGGPAAMEGSLKVNDRIQSVAQGKEGKPVETVDMRLDKVVEMIRGKKGTVVRLTVIPADASGGKRKVVDITRDEVKLTEQQARAEIIEVKMPETGEVQRLGFLTLPSFYADMERSRSARTAKSTTRDVQALIGRLQKEGIAGLVIDLRRNGGGSLEEAINLTGLFIKKGPVVQSKDANKQVNTMHDRDASIYYSGPLVVLTSHLSASASEIFAGALQDYNRAVIVGDRSTFGKGTVQTMLEVGRFMNPFGFKQADAGSLKLTIQKFYRVSGASTQLRGVESDVVLPSPYAALELGESALKGPLPYDEVRPAEYEKFSPRPFELASLRAKSATRVGADLEFRFMQDDLQRTKERIASNRVSLSKEVRLAETAADKARGEERKAQRLAAKRPDPLMLALPLEDVEKPELKRVKIESPDAKKKDKPSAPRDGDGEEEDADSSLSASTDKAQKYDPVKFESLAILGDLIEQLRRPAIAKSRE